MRVPCLIVVLVGQHDETPINGVFPDLDHGTVSGCPDVGSGRNGNIQTGVLTRLALQENLGDEAALRQGPAGGKAALGIRGSAAATRTRGWNPHRRGGGVARHPEQGHQVPVTAFQLLELPGQGLHPAILGSEVEDLCFQLVDSSGLGSEVPPASCHAGDQDR